MIQTTGIPPHVSIISQLDTFNGSVSSLLDRFEVQRDHIVDSIVQVLEDRAMSANQVTYSGLDARIRETFESLGIRDMLDQVIQNSSNKTFSTASR
jgi:hypothetical protein